MTASGAKKARDDGHAVTTGATFAVSGLVITDHKIQVPLDYSGATPGTITVAFREVFHRNKKDDRTLPYLLYFQGGPGFESPRLLESSGWIKQAINYFHVVLMDQRGTGLSSPITVDNLLALGSGEAQAEYLSYFRADSIVRDAEAIRKALVPAGNHDGRWSILGQSFGGFCCLTYLSFASEGITEALVTAGVPPRVREPCSADAVYTRTVARVVEQNRRFYERFPRDAPRIAAIVRHLADAQDSGRPVLTPAGTSLTVQAFQGLGMGTLAFSSGFERLHYLVEGAWDEGVQGIEAPPAAEARRGEGTPAGDVAPDAAPSAPAAEGSAGSARGNGAGKAGKGPGAPASADGAPSPSDAVGRKRGRDSTGGSSAPPSPLSPPPRRLSHAFLRQVDQLMPWESNPLYALLHESIYCQGGEASDWSAQRAVDAAEGGRGAGSGGGDDFSGPPRALFDGAARARAGSPVLLYGEFALKWIYRDVPSMRPLLPAAEALHARTSWSPLYSPRALARNTAPVAALVGLDDMFVDSELSQETLAEVAGNRAWITNEYLHCGIREAGPVILERLLNMTRGGVLLR